ncbi:MAG: hypothetical protein IPM66_14160 [Acidobacteriota bacterium]|nr:MAG: hypothetical protein IPM66_14160 [Acidobacteriota bacterium]
MSSISSRLSRIIPVCLALLACASNPAAAQTTTWAVKPDPDFRIQNASIPNVGHINNEVWLVVGGPGGLRLFRSQDGDNDTVVEAISGLGTALNGTGFVPTETIPREAGVPELFVLGLAPPGVNQSVVFRLRRNEAGNFIRDPVQPVFSGAPADNQFLGVPDVYPTADGNLRMVYVARGAARQNSRTAISTDGGASFTFEFDDPFGDLNVQMPGPGNTNVDPAVVRLASGAYLAVTMRLKKLYLFGSQDGRVFTPLNQGAAIEPAVFSPTATGFFDPTLVRMPDGRILMYVTLEEPGQSESVVRATLVPTTQLTSVSAASYKGSMLAPESIVAAFGTGLANTTESATGQPLPIELAGTEVRVIDGNGIEQAAPLFFVSPNQVNYMMPAGMASGAASVRLKAGEAGFAEGQVMIEKVSPGLFSANADGRGAASAVVLRVRADGSQVYSPAARFDSEQNQFVPATIDPGEEGDQLFLILFGTGLRNRSALSTVTATIGGTEVAVAFAGSQPDFAGLDQVNLMLPRSLAGRGDLDLSLIVDGKAANVVAIRMGEIPPAAYFEFDSPPIRDTFVIKLTDPAKIMHARQLLNGMTTQRPHVMGIIVKSPVPWNAPWSYHLDPVTIDFFDFAIEVCDGSVSYIEEHLAEVGGALLPGNRWCPWGSRLIREVTPK